MQICRFRTFAARALLCFSLVMLPRVLQAQSSEFRAVWVDAWGNGFLNASQVTTLVNHCRTYNFNAVVVQMRRRGDAFYMPQSPNLEPRTSAIASNFDALQEIINQCNTGTPKIEVHCWIPTFLVGDTSSPSKTGHVMNVRPQYLMKNRAGATLIGEGYYLDPGNPDAQTWNYNVAKDIVSRYNVTGFHWDYIRYPQADAGYNDVAIARYNNEYGLTGLPTTSDTQFSNWRRRQVTEFLRWVNADLLAIKTNLIISASVFGSRSDAFNARFQDWSAWNSEGLIDLCMPMVYIDRDANPGLFESRTDDAFVNQGVRRVYIGPGAYLNTKENTLLQLQYVRNKGFLGSSLYSYRVPNSGTVNQTATFTHIRDNHHPTSVPTPTLPWKTAPTKGIIKGLVSLQGSTNVPYKATVTLTGASSRNQTTEGHGRYAFWETIPGNYTVSVTYPGVSSASSNVTLVAGQILTVNLALSTNDTSAPVISNIQVENITDTTATISWDTDEPANSVVEYGLTTSYGNIVSNATRVVTRDMLLTGLAPDTTYRFRVHSRDASNNLRTSANQSFTTNPSGVVDDVILESRAANGTLTGNPPYSEAGFLNSTLKSSAAGLSGSTTQGSRYANAGTPSFTFTPTLPVPGGTYDVYLSHGSAATISDDVNVSVSVTGATGLPSSTLIFREPGGNTWELLGRMVVDAGNSSPALTFTRSAGTLSDSSRMYADAIKFVHVTLPPAITVQPQSQVIGIGSNLTLSVQASGTSLAYQWYRNNGLISGATQSAYIRASAQTSDEGTYRVVVSNSAGTTNSVNATVSVRAALNTFVVGGGSVTRDPNQSFYELDTAVTLTANPSAGFVFSGWSGAASGTNNPITLILSTNRTVTATFVSAVPDLIVDNEQAVFAGSWTTSSAGDDWDISFRDAAASTSVSPTATATFRPNIPSTAFFDVYVWHPSVPATRTTNAQYTISGTSGSSTVSLNQMNNPGTWRLLSSGKQFSAGTNGFVMLGNNVGQTGPRVVADAVKWVYANTQSTAPTVVTPPSSQSVRLGDPINFSVVAGGSAPFQYQWKFQNTNIAGATGNVLNLSEVQSSDIGQYAVVISNSFGTVTSSPANLTLIAPSEPHLQEFQILPNNSVRFLFDAEGGYTYTLQVSTNLVNWNTLTNIVHGGGTIEIIDDSSAGDVQRFYRSRWAP